MILAQKRDHIYEHQRDPTTRLLALFRPRSESQRAGDGSVSEEHETMLDEIRQRFGSFQDSDRRIQLFNRLEQLLMELRKSGCFAAVVIDGSFVAAKRMPEDVDLIVVLPQDHDWTADLSPSDYALVSRSTLRRRFGFDVPLAAGGGSSYERYVEFFGRVREDASARKGMLRIQL
jgi:hypothetical protein